MTPFRSNSRRGRELLLALRRFAVLLALGSAVIASLSIALGAIVGASAGRAISVGFYLCGSFMLVGGFFMGNRGPLRLKNTDDAVSFLPFWGSRAVRWATPNEREEAINVSALYVVLGLVLIVIGVAVDTRYRLF